MRRTLATPGSASRVGSWPLAFLNQSQMRPTNGEISVTRASAHATACAKLKSSVRLQWMPSFSSCSAALMPSHVLPSLIKMRSRSTPASAYSLMSCFAFSMLPFVSNE